KLLWITSLACLFAFAQSAEAEENLIIEPDHMLVAALANALLYKGCDKLLDGEHKVFCWGFTGMATFIGGAVFEAVQNDIADAEGDIASNGMGILAIGLSVSLFEW
ncbi:MAG: hypothetical protein KAS32_30705, partial [Candidatus Peribacteraceae bacterium]|nr:hypothetical protein [Candidatus Peribacteraceae bacterium]